MATTTPNYGWPVPTSTDYVKDGATAIEALGDAIDATVFGLPSAGMKFITRATVSNSATAVFDNIFSTSYYNYLVVIEDAYSHGSANDDFQLQFRYGATTQSTLTTSTYYANSLNTYASTGSVGNFGSNAASSAYLSSDIGLSTSSTSGYLFFERVGNASQIPRFNGNVIGYGNIGLISVVGGNNSTADIYKGISLKTASGNITCTISVYGMAKA